MALKLANTCTWLQVYSALVYLMVYQISRVCLAFMYMQHRQMVYSKLHRHHYLVLYQNASDNAYSSLLRHEVCMVDHKMVMLGIDFCYNKFSHLCVKHQYYPENITVCMYIFFPYVFSIWPDQWDHFWDALFQMLLKLFSLTYFCFLVASVHLHMGIKSVWTRKLNIRHLLIYIMLINGI